MLRFSRGSMKRSSKGWTLAIAIALVACSGKLDDGKERACSPGDFRYCDCPAPITRGYSLCADDGSAYGACDCSGKVPPCAGVVIAATDAACVVAPPGFLTDCAMSACNAPQRCFPFNAYGPHCTLDCDKDTDCPAPSP